jgi:hypothetical protein
MIVARKENIENIPPLTRHRGARIKQGFPEFRSGLRSLIFYTITEMKNLGVVMGNVLKYVKDSIDTV